MGYPLNAGSQISKVFPPEGASHPLPEPPYQACLGNLGFRVGSTERTYRVTPAGLREEQGVWLHDMTLERASGGDLDIAAIERPIEAALLALFRRLAESDGFNKLVLEAGLGWRDVAMIRALARYLRQARIAYAQDYIANTLARNGAIAEMIVDHFYARFDPHAARKRMPDEAQAKTREKNRGGARRCGEPRR